MQRQIQNLPIQHINNSSSPFNMKLVAHEVQLCSFLQLPNCPAISQIQDLNKYNQAQLNSNIVFMEQSSQFTERYYQSDHNDFLRPTGLLSQKDSLKYPLIPDLTPKFQRSPYSSKNSTKKKKGIEKKPKSTGEESKPPKRVKSNEANPPMGRPLNGNIQKDHLAINRSFNDIIYHFSRGLIFLKLKQGRQTSIHALQLQNYQSAWMYETDQIMSLQNFPTYEEDKPAFLLHPNSLHFVFYYRLQSEGKTQYNEQEVKYMFLAFLKKRKILTSTIYQYVTAYWSDIIFLLNHPQGSRLIDNQHFQSSGEVQEMMPLPQLSQNRQNDGNRANNSSKSREEKGGKAAKKRKAEVTELQGLKSQLAKDESIAAYQIACYLHACCLKFKLSITSYN